MTAVRWSRKTAETPQGTFTVTEPVIVSAGRSTDIPAFYTDEFMDCIEKGYTGWSNPFNPSQFQYVSFNKTRVFVFFTKNPRPIMGQLHVLDRKKIGFYFHFTLNDYVFENLEPGLPPLEVRLETFKDLSGMVGPDKVIWRFDPVQLTERLGSAELLKRVRNIAEYLEGYTRRLVFSFVDIKKYRTVQKNLRKLNINCREPNQKEQQELAEGFAGIGNDCGLEIYTCAQQNDFSSLGIRRGKCVDDFLMARLFPEDRRLADFLFGSGKKMKDPGQRKQCRCVLSKNIGNYNTCRHGCAYCYAKGYHDNSRSVFPPLPCEDISPYIISETE